MITRKQINQWLPCEAYPPERIDALFGPRDELSLDDIWNLGLDAEAFTWICMRETVLPLSSFESLMQRFIERCGRLIGRVVFRQEVAEAYNNACYAKEGEIVGLPRTDDSRRWLKGCTEKEKRLALCALWCAVAVARHAGPDKALRSAAWSAERTHQIADLYLEARYAERTTAH